MAPRRNYSGVLSIAEVLLVLIALIFLVFVVIDFSADRTSEGLKDVEATATALAVAGLIRFGIKPSAGSNFVRRTDHSPHPRGGHSDGRERGR